MDFDTTYINFFAGPGSGKSVLSNELYTRFEKEGLSAQSITEFAKDRVWEESTTVLKCQPYIIGGQILRQFVLRGKVEVVFVDSPIPLGIAYKGFGCNEDWEKGVIYQFNSFRNINFLLLRNPDLITFKTKGRIHSYEESLKKDEEIVSILKKHNIPYYEITPQKDGSHLTIITDIILEELNKTV